MPTRLPRVVERGQLRERGFTTRMIDTRLASGAWRRLLPRTYLTSDTLTPGDRLDAALAFAGQGAALSGAAALIERSIRGVAVPDRILVVVPASNRCEPYAWARVRPSARPVRLEDGSGRSCVAAARAAADLALDLHRIDDVRALVARVVGDGHATLAELGDELAAGPRGGSRLLRRALAEVADGAASAPEARAAALLRRHGIDGFEQNAVITLRDGSRYVADFLWRARRAVLEIDSVEYHLGPKEWRRTMDRHLALAALGYSVVHRPPSALRDEAGFVRDVLAWLRSQSVIVS